MEKKTVIVNGEPYPPVSGIIGGLYMDDEPAPNPLHRIKVINDYGSTEYWIDDKQIFPPDDIYWEVEWQTRELPEWVKAALERGV